jgi:hypothetical protein
VPELGYSILQTLFSAYKSSAAEALLAERGHIDSSHQMIDATLEYAFDCYLPRAPAEKMSVDKLVKPAQSLPANGPHLAPYRRVWVVCLVRSDFFIPPSVRCRTN